MSGRAAEPAAAAPTTERCRFCWMCRQVCPVGHVTARETLTPHAWALVIESVKRGQLSWNRESANVMYACADCGLCRSHCVTDQALPDAIVKARAEIVRRGVAPDAVADVDRKLIEFSNPYVAEAPAPANGARGAVALYVGDAGRHVAPRVVDAAIRLLKASRIDAVPIGSGRSTGLLANTLGLTKTADSLARAGLQEVAASGATELLVLGPGDRWTFEYVYPQRLGIPWPAGVRVREVTEVLAEAMADGRLKFTSGPSLGTFAYHDPCHGPRVAVERPAPRALVEAATGSALTHRLFWHGHRAHPCGAVGGLEFTMPDLARALAEARLTDAVNAGATVLVTEDPACLAHLGGLQRRPVSVTSLFELLADRL